jgi:methionine synthase I (cobalamin-dependent)
LDRYGQGHATRAINRAATELALQSAGPAGFVLGDIGPSTADQSGAAAEQAAILLESGVDGILLETFRAGPVESVLAEVARVTAGAVPIIASLWEWPESAASLARRLLDNGATVLGMNCRGGIDAFVTFAERMSGHVSCPLFLKPSAAPGSADGRPAAFASLAQRLLDKNVCFLGGCCGTNEAHVAAIALALRNRKAGVRRRSGASA